MRTYEIEVTVQTTVKRTITSEKAETHDTLTQAALELEGLAGHTLIRSHVVDKTPKPPTDKQRFNAAFRELRKLGYTAKQSLPKYSEVGANAVWTEKEDMGWGFIGQRLAYMVPVNWSYTLDTADDERMVEQIMAVFKRHGFDVQWEGKYYHAVEIRGGK